MIFTHARHMHHENRRRRGKTQSKLSETVSSEFWQMPSKPNSSAVIVRSIGRPCQRGGRAKRHLIDTAAGVDEAFGVAIQHLKPRHDVMTKCSQRGFVKCVKPGIMVSVCCSATSKPPLQAYQQGNDVVQLSRNHRRMSVATLIVTATTSMQFLPTAPIMSVKRDSTFMHAFAGRLTV